jgi:hypothetical protein
MTQYTFSTGQRIEGWPVHRRGESFYAVKKAKDGRMKWVSLGKSLDGAAEKIQAAEAAAPAIPAKAAPSGPSHGELESRIAAMRKDVDLALALGRTIMVIRGELDSIRYEVDGIKSLRRDLDRIEGQMVEVRDRMGLE